MGYFDDTSPIWAVVIDTDSESYLFVDHLFAFCTGIDVDGDGTFGEMIELFREEHDINPFPLAGDMDWIPGIPSIIALPMSEEYRKACEIHPNPNWFRDGYNNYYRYSDHPSEEEMFETYIRSVESHQHPRGHNVEKALENMRRGTGGIIREPAYLSVAIFFDSEPKLEQYQIIRSRAELFFEEYTFGRSGVKQVTMEGQRLVERTVSLRDHRLWSRVG